MLHATTLDFLGQGCASAPASISSKVSSVRFGIFVAASPVVTVSPMSVLVAVFFMMVVVVAAMVVVVVVVAAFLSF